jgi:hypothetical protein
VIQPLPEAHLASPYSTLRNRRHSTYPPTQHDRTDGQRSARRREGDDRAGRQGRRDGLDGLFSEERITDRAASLSSSSESSSTTEDERAARRRQPHVDVDEDAVPEAARDLHQPRTNSLPRTTSRRREANTGEETRFSHFFHRHRHDADDPSPLDDTGHHSHSLFRHAPDFSFPLRTLPRVRRQGTTRYLGDGSDEAVDVGDNGTAGFMRSVWGTGRQQSDGE